MECSPLDGEAVKVVVGAGSTSRERSSGKPVPWKDRPMEGDTYGSW
jgi:hypothetical protein